MQALSHGMALVHQLLHARGKLGAELRTSQNHEVQAICLQHQADGIHHSLPSPRRSPGTGHLHGLILPLNGVGRVNCPSENLSNPALFVDIRCHMVHMPKILTVIALAATKNCEMDH